MSKKTTLAELRAKLEEEKSKASFGNKDGQLFPFWSQEPDTTSVVRFLPDGDESNTYFWKERQVIKIPFAGIKHADGRLEDATGPYPLTVTVPCIEMYEQADTGVPFKKCPVMATIRPWFKDPSMEDTARTYWKKRSFLYQGFVTDNKVAEDIGPAAELENPIRRFVINTTIHNIIKDGLMNPEIENHPTDYDSGLDFKIVKTKPGKWADYGLSNYARKERALDADERAAIAEHGLFKLFDFLPKYPDAANLETIFEMFLASVDGEYYDVERWGNSGYRPWGLDAPETATSTSAESAEPQAAKIDPAVTAGDESDEIEDIIAKIKRKKAEADAKAAAAETA